MGKISENKIAEIGTLTKPWPVLPWLRGYNIKLCRFDIVAGLTSAGVVIPTAMAYATIAGLPVETGLYTALVPMVIYAILGTSQTMSFTTTPTLAILTATELALVAPGGSPADLLTAAATLAVLVGIFLFIASLLRFGFIADFISDPVLTGYKAGIGFIVIVGQIPKMFGIHIEKGSIIQDIGSILSHIGQSHMPTVVIALIALIIFLGIEHFLPRIPAPLVVVVLGIVASVLLSLENKGISILGQIPAGLPAPVLPDLSLVSKLWPGALGIALMAFVSSIASGRAFIRRGDPRPNANRELFAIGLANIAGGLFRSLPACGATPQTAVNYNAGARTQFAELITAAIVIATLLFIAPVIGLMPQATLAAIVVVSASGLLNPREFVAILKIRNTEFWWGLIAFVGVVVVGTLQGIMIAVVFSIITMFYIANHPPVYVLGRKKGTGIFRPLSAENPEDETFSGLLIVRTEGTLTFSSTPHLGKKIWEIIDKEKPKVLLLDCGAIPNIEYTALKILIGFEEKLEERGIALWLASLNPRALKIIKRSSLFAKLESDKIFPNVEQAVAAYTNE